MHTRALYLGAIIFSKELFEKVKIQDPVSCELIIEHDYVVLKNEELNIFGYGINFEAAFVMLEDQLLIAKENLEEGIINEENSVIKQLALLRER